ncbi:MAG: class I SAM-dependent methyltransferase [Acidobacteriota bacterium]|nr:class I SAM-dependent methyltransferase [Acidobacteriota bacterium]MDH3530975.1 class I SAM-dependent methyltransferase [Acidobacteriota bacterium]
MGLAFKDFERVQRLEVIESIASGQSVLHLGCTNYPYTKEAIESDMLLHDSLQEVSGELYGFDQDRRGIEILEKRGTKNLYEAGLERLEEVDLDRKFDVIVAGEIIEHLNNPGLFLEGIKRFMNPETKLVITTVNAYCAMRFFVYWLRGKQGSNEPVHPDHVAYYSYRTLSLLLQRHRLKRTRFMFYDLGVEHRPHNRWYMNMFNDLAVRLSPQLSDGIIAVCQLEDEPFETRGVVG